MIIDIIIRVSTQAQSFAQFLANHKQNQPPGGSHSMRRGRGNTIWGICEEVGDDIEKSEEVYGDEKLQELEEVENENYKQLTKDLVQKLEDIEGKKKEKNREIFKFIYVNN